MNFNTISSSQAGCTQPFNHQANSFDNKQTLVTANPTIFPSLNPLAGLYRNKPSSIPTTTIRRPSSSQEPIKKIKTGNNGREVVVMPMNNQESVRMSKKEYTNRIISSKTSDDELFRVPQLPKRLRDQKKNKEQKQEQNQFVQRIQEFQSVGGAPSDMMAVYYQSAAHNQTQIPFVARKEESKPLVNNHCQAQDFRAVNSAIDPLVLNALYQRLSLEIYHFQLRQNMINMAQLSQ